MVQRSIFVLWLILAGTALAQREGAVPSTEVLLNRIERMEREAIARDRRIQEMEIEIAEQKSARADDPLETEINALLSAGDMGVVGAPKSSVIKVTGQWRARGEYRSVKAYDAARVEDDNDFVIQRTRLNFDAQVLDDVRVFLTFQDSRMWGEEQSPLGDLEGVDFHEAYAEFSNVFGQPWSFKVGRQEISLGDQRLVSPLDWDVVGRAFDGVRTTWKAETWSLNLWVFNVDENSPPAHEKSDDDKVFDGAYFSWTGLENHTIDLYLMHIATSDGSVTGEDGATGDAERVTIGALFKGSASGFAYSVEGDYQFGDQVNDDVSAYAVAVTFGYTFDHEWKPTLAIEWDFGSGDEDPTDGDAETFDPLFPFGHYYQGYLDIFSWKNGHDFALRANVKPDPDWFVEAAFHYFLLAEDRDAWYNAAGAAIRRVNAGGVSDDVGAEIDLHAKYQLNAATALWFGYSHFFAGDYVSDSGRDRDTDWVFFQMTLNF